MNITTYLIIAYLIFFLCTTTFSFLINSLFLKFAKTLGIRNNDDRIIRWRSQAKPAFGGISFYILFLLSFASYSILFAPEDSGQILLNKQLVGLLAAVTLAFLMGLADDAYNTIPLLKLFTQICCGLILISSGTYISLFSYMPLNYAITLFWVVGMMNSLNMLDNMDAITASVSIFIILSLILIICSQHGFTNIHLLMLTGILSALLGFLYFNWHPSKMFMGDTGSQFLGIFLATMGITHCWNFIPFEFIAIDFNLLWSKQIIIALLVFIIPLTDTTTVVINRIAKGQSPFIGGTDHTTHHLSYLGLSEKQVALLFSGISLISLMSIFIIIRLIENWSYLHFSLFAIYFLIIFGLLFYCTKTNEKPGNLPGEKQERNTT